MKLIIEIDTSFDKDAEMLRQIASILETGVPGTKEVIDRVSEETLKEIKNASPGENLQAERDALKRSIDAAPKPKKKEKGATKKKNKETSALQFQLKNTAHSLSIQDKETFNAWRTDVLARYGTTVIDELPAADLPALIEELESLLDGEK